MKKHAVRIRTGNAMHIMELDKDVDNTIAEMESQGFTLIDTHTTGFASLHRHRDDWVVVTMVFEEYE
jgi:hypothetical protein